MNKPKVDRRNFLIALGLGGAGAVAGAVAGQHPQPAQPAANSAQPGSKGYRVSAHIRKYYRTTRV
ncbi:MAG TPA: twin-arginine translocation signal domain-containing protein [Burkholderiales bacterium]|nr:twin-arginine translocation signal domain-containing protein [Burkholderiales bacterium]